MTVRTSLITDWHTCEEDLPDVAPGDEYERAIAPQKFIVLHRIVVRDTVLVRLKIGTVEDVPFELESTAGRVRTYRLKDLDDDDLKESLVRTGAVAVTRGSIAVVPALEVRLFLRNESDVPVKLRVALIVQEELAG